MSHLAIAMAAAYALAGSGPAVQSAADRATAAHIAAIEHGLVPPTIIANRPRPESSLLARMRATHTPGVSIAFFENGRIVWARGYGLADVAAGRPVTPGTRFQAGSISKAVTAVGALRMVQAGTLDLDQDVNARLRGWRVPDSPLTAQHKVTLRGLLSHTAGLTVHGYPGYALGAPVPDTLQVLNGAPPANSEPVQSATAPGQQWSYSGGGYVVAQLLMSETAGEPFPSLMRRLVFEPTGMTHSTFDQDRSPAPADLATGYEKAGVAVPGGHNTYPEMGAAGLWTTPSDLARFAIAVQRSAARSPRALLGPKVAGEMMTRTLNNWGLGGFLGPPDGPAIFEHAGDDRGFQAHLFAYTGGQREGVAIMTNGDGGATLIPEILGAIAETYHWSLFRPKVVRLADVSGDRLAALTGVYDIAGVGSLRVTTADDRLFVQSPVIGPRPWEMLPLSGTQFLILDLGLTVDFQQAPGGAISGMHLGGVIWDVQAERRR